MTRLAVVAFPVLEENDRQWIESIRATHDPQGARIGVHFTLVFPVEFPANLVVDEASAVARSVGPISFTIRHAEAVADRMGAGGHVFLVPDEGRGTITHLHDLLHAGALRHLLRADMPFIPHMTVAAKADMKSCKRLAHDINTARRTLRGSLPTMELIDVDSPRVQSLRTLQLGQQQVSG